MDPISPPPPLWRPLAGRSFALALGFFCACNVLGALCLPDFDASLWLLDLRFLPHRLALALVGVLGLALLCLALGASPRFPRLGPIARGMAFLGAAVALLNAAMCWRAWAAGSSVSSFPVPFSLAVAGGMAAAGFWCGPLRGGAVARTVRLAVAAPGVGLLLVFLQLTLFGLTDYRAKADVAVVYGARAYPDGRCSDALEDRVLAGVALYKAGLVPKLLMSGGPVAGAGPGQVQDEPEAMRRFAMEQGVPAEAILLDPLGVSTVATAESTARLARENGWKRVLAVSHFYHLSRAKLTMQRAGVLRQAQVRTVPSGMRGRVLAKLPWFMLREVGAFVKDFAAPKRAVAREGRL